MTDFFFKEKLDYDKNLLKWKTMGDSEVKKSLGSSHRILSSLRKWDLKSLEEVLFREAENFNKEQGYPQKDRGYLLWPLRVSLSGKQASASPFEIAEILGKEKTLQRVQQTIDILYY
jgi:glutamyl/glutaminyl-tRNA synthetase